MPRVTNIEAAARRERVAPLWLQGVPVSGIAASLGIDWETARRDIGVLAARAVKELDVEKELARLLLAGRAIESDAWHTQQLGVAMSAQRQQLAVLQVLQAMDTARRVEALEQRLDELVAVVRRPREEPAPANGQWSGLA